MMKIKKFRECKKGTLQGFLDIYLPKIKWTLKGCGLFLNADENRYWVNLPARTYKDPEGKERYAYIIDMPKEMKEEFCTKALEAYWEWTKNGEDHSSEDDEISYK